MQKKDKDPHLLNKILLFATTERIELGTGQGDRVKKRHCSKMGNLEGISAKSLRLTNTNDFLIYDKLFAQFLIYIRKPLLIDDFATDPF
jgi:hypothetical protein